MKKYIFLPLAILILWSTYKDQAFSWLEKQSGPAAYACSAVHNLSKKDAGQLAGAMLVLWIGLKARKFWKGRRGFEALSAADVRLGTNDAVARKVAKLLPSVYKKINKAKRQGKMDLTIKYLPSAAVAATLARFLTERNFFARTDGGSVVTRWDESSCPAPQQKAASQQQPAVSVKTPDAYERLLKIVRA